VLAYVFWHQPAPGVGVAAYEARLARFHAGLQGEGVRASLALALGDVPWLDGGGPGYEDWYLVEDFAALGALNAAAVSGALRAPHDAAAASTSANGAAGVMAHLHGPLLPDPPAWEAWLAKPAGMAYPAFHAALAEALAAGPPASAWQRQMTLGPAAEYCVLAGAPLALPWPARAWPVRAAVPAARG
jgi:hypothetical protein